MPREHLAGHQHAPARKDRGAIAASVHARPVIGAHARVIVQRRARRRVRRARRPAAHTWSPARPARREVLDSRPPAWRERRSATDLVAGKGQARPESHGGRRRGSTILAWNCVPYRGQPSGAACGASSTEGSVGSPQSRAPRKLGIRARARPPERSSRPTVVRLAHQGEEVRRSAPVAPIPLVDRRPTTRPSSGSNASRRGSGALSRRGARPIRQGGN